jgi:glycosyltransferase domain-containing protein
MNTRLSAEEPSLLLVIPTHNRPKKLARTLGFLDYQQKVLPYNFIIHLLDSSDTEELHENINTKNSLREELNVVHHDYSGKGVYEKFKHFFLAYLIDSSDHFCVIGDDDLLNLNNLFEAHNFLCDSPDYTSANGFILTADLRKSYIRGLMPYRQDSSEADSAAERLLRHLKNYTNNFYSVFKAKEIAKFYLMIFDMDIGRSLKERLASASVIISGKRKILDGTFVIRDKSDQTGYDEHGNRTLDDNPSSADYLHSITFGYDRYESALLSWLGQASNIDTISIELRREFEEFKIKKNKKYQLFIYIKIYIKIFLEKITPRKNRVFICQAYQFLTQENVI